MVCVPCIFIPVLLFLWHKFIQPYVLRFWNPWANKSGTGKKDATGQDEKTEFPFTCQGGACPFPNKTTKDTNALKDADKIIDAQISGKEKVQ